MPERLVDEDAGELVVEDDRISGAADTRSIEQIDRALRDDTEPILIVLDTVPSFAQADRLEPLLDVAVTAADRGPRQDDLRPQLVQGRACFFSDSATPRTSPSRSSTASAVCAATSARRIGSSRRTARDSSLARRTMPGNSSSDVNEAIPQPQPLLSTRTNPP